MKSSPLTFQTLIYQRALVLGALAAAASGVCHGQLIVNGDFEGAGTGSFTPGWTTAGDASIQGPTFNGGSSPASGNQFNAIVTSIIADDAAPFSGISAVSRANMESFLGLSDNALSLQGRGTVLEGSAFKQTFTATAGDKISFLYNFYTAENTVSPLGRDYGFITLQFAAFNPSITVLADPKSGLHGSPGGLLSTFSSETGYKGSALVTIPISGTWTLGFGVADTITNPGQDSALGISDVTLIPVPEPWAWSLLSGLALGAFAFVRRLAGSQVG